jgi:hypothetical protein
MQFDIYRHTQYYIDRVILGILFIAIVTLLGMMGVTPWYSGESTFEEYDLPFSAYVISSIVVLILSILAFSRLTRIGAKNKLDISESGIKIITDILQTENKIDWEHVISLKRDYENWGTDITDQIWILEQNKIIKKKKIRFLVNSQQTDQLDKLVKNKIRTAPNN